MLQNLQIYQLARKACAEAYRVAANIRDPEMRDQIRRASMSVVLNIAEGYGRSSPADFARFLAIARGSNNELDAQLQFAGDIGLIDGKIADALRVDLGICGRMISTLIRRLRAG
jgi:four helix bundle protein